MSIDATMPVTLFRDRRGAVGIVFALLAPVLLLAATVAMDRIGEAREILELQGLADRAAISAGPLWAEGQRERAIAIAAALVAIDGGGARLDHAGTARHGRWAKTPEAIEISVSRQRRRFVSDILGSGRPSARAVAIKTRRVA